MALDVMDAAEMQTGEDAMNFHYGNLALNLVKEELDCPCMVITVDPDTLDVYISEAKIKTLTPAQKSKLLETLKFYIKEFTN
jgi:hypothetical protein